MLLRVSLINISLYNSKSQSFRSITTVCAFSYISIFSVPKDNYSILDADITEMLARVYSKGGNLASEVM